MTSKGLVQLVFDTAHDERLDATPCHVLVVDDEPAIVELLAILLCDAGLTVSTAHDGQEALSLIARHPVDVVLSDICMQGLSGIELISQIRTIDENIKVILMTGFDSYDMVKASLKAGAYDYLDKPLSDHELVVSAVRRAGESVRLMRQNARLLDCLKTSNAKLAAANRRLTQLNKQLRKLAITDGLTQLYNRRYIDDWIQNFILTRVHQDRCLSVILIDVDHFKVVNDTRGHDAGDEVLRHLSTLLASFGRETDLVGRYGGEEFVVVMPETAAQDAMQAAERLRKRIYQTPLELDSGLVNISVSLGIASSSAGKQIDPALDVNGRELIAQADKALYAAKAGGRNTCVHHDELLDTLEELYPELPQAAKQ